MSQPVTSQNTLRALREQFDGGFALAREEQDNTRKRFVLASAGGQPIAVELEDLSGVVRAGRLAPMAQALPGFAGLAGVRMRLYPVWHLGPFLQSPQEGARNGTEVAFLALCRTEEPLAFALDSVEGLVTVSTQSLQPLGEGTQGHIFHHLLYGSSRRPVVSVAAVLRTLQERQT